MIIGEHVNDAQIAAILEPIAQKLQGRARAVGLDTWDLVAEGWPRPRPSLTPRNLAHEARCDMLNCIERERNWQRFRGCSLEDLP